jgi:Reverse transcriptase (RNA-dependent DNA polymerase)
MFERVLLTRLQKHADINEIIPPAQFGFRAGHSSVHQVARLVSAITTARDDYKVTAAIFLDVAKAFDRVWHEGLLVKLISLDFPPYLIHLSRSFLLNRSFRVQWNTSLSSQRPIAAGVPQGSVLAPFYFNVFTHDFPPPPPHVIYGIFADDVTALAMAVRAETAVERGQVALDSAAAWYTMWRMGLNASKTCATLFSHYQRQDLTPFRLHGKDVNWSSTNNCLGVLLDKRLTFGPHISMVVAKATGKQASLYPLLRSSTMSVETKLRLYTAVIRPSMIYAAPVWSKCATYHIQGLQVLQNKILRLIVGVSRATRMSDIHTDLGIAMVGDYLDQLYIRFLESLRDSENPTFRSLIKDLSVSDFLKFKRKRTFQFSDLGPPAKKARV